MNTFKRFYLWQENFLNHLTNLKSPVIFLTRIYIAQIFFLSGLTKLRDWDSTLFLFEEEYHVPLLPPELAAYLGTGGELILPIMLLLGFFTRASGIGLLIVNIVAAISLQDITQAAFSQHVLWGTLLIAITIFGGGRVSLDAYIYRAKDKIQKN